MKLAVAALLAAVALASSAAAMPFDQHRVRKPLLPKKIVVFGDSLSDNGNIGALTGEQFPPAPAYPFHTFSNGPLWPDYLKGLVAKQLNSTVTLVDTAIAGATTAADYMTGGYTQFDLPIKSTISQARDYVNANRATDAAANDADSSSNLYVVFTGGNDVLTLVQQHDYNAAYIPLSDWRYGAFYTVALRVDDIVYSLINDLHARNILLVNLAAIDKSPFITKYFPANATYANQLVTEFNNQVLDIAAAYSSAPAYGDFDRDDIPRVRVFDVHSTFATFDSPNNPYGLTFSEPIPSFCIDYVLETINPLCLNASSGYNPVFWDLLHPTTYVHSIIAQDIFTLLQNAF